MNLAVKMVKVIRIEPFTLKGTKANSVVILSLFIIVGDGGGGKCRLYYILRHKFINVLFIVPEK